MIASLSSRVPQTKRRGRGYFDRPLLLEIAANIFLLDSQYCQRVCPITEGCPLHSRSARDCPLNSLLHLRDIVGHGDVFIRADGQESLAISFHGVGRKS